MVTLLRRQRPAGMAEAQLLLLQQPLLPHKVMILTLSQKREDVVRPHLPTCVSGLSCYYV